MSPGLHGGGLPAQHSIALWINAIPVRVDRNQSFGGAGPAGRAGLCWTHRQNKWCLGFSEVASRMGASSHFSVISQSFPCTAQKTVWLRWEWHTLCCVEPPAHSTCQTHLEKRLSERGRCELSLFWQKSHLLILACPTLNFHMLEWIISILNEKQRKMARNYSGWVSNTLGKKCYEENLWGIADWGFCTARFSQSLSPK